MYMILDMKLITILFILAVYIDNVNGFDPVFSFSDNLHHIPVKFINTARRGGVNSVRVICPFGSAPCKSSVNVVLWS